MITRRSSRLLRCFQPWSSAPALTVGSAGVEGQYPILSSALALNAAPPRLGRSYSVGSFWDVTHQARNDLYIELSTARGMLPHRSNFSPQFTPHGVQLIPHRLPLGLQGVATPLPSLDEAEQDAPVMVDSVKRKRRLKMKKHKYKKRMKQLRHQLK